MSQTSWELLPDIDAESGPALASHTDGKVYALAVSEQGFVAASTIDDPESGWDSWEIIGPRPTGGVGPMPFLADPNTMPLLLADGASLHGLVRGQDDNLYETHRRATGGWSDWQKLTQKGEVKGRISAAIGTSGGNQTTHVLHEAPSGSIEYRRFDSDWSPVGAAERWTAAPEGVIVSNGGHEVVVFVARSDGSLSVERRRDPWQGSWDVVATLRPAGTAGSLFNLSNAVYLAGDYHIVYVRKTLSDDVSGSYSHALTHARFRADLPDDGYGRVLMEYEPAGDRHPKATLVDYRNKLVAGYHDEEGLIRYSWWDSADSSTPWSGNAFVAGGRTSSRIALVAHDGRSGLSSAGRLSANFGNDVIAVVRGLTRNRLYYINFTRTLLADRLKRVDLEVAWCTDYSGTLADCPEVADLPVITEVPVFTEVGFGTLALPDWFTSRVYWRTMKASKTPTKPYYTWVHTQDIRPYVGPNLNIGFGADYLRWFEEMGHLMSSSFGLCDDGYCKSWDERQVNEPDPNLMSPLISDAAAADAFKLFAEATDASRACKIGTGTGSRCRGFTGHFSDGAPNYDVESRQHSWLYIPYYYMSDGTQLREWIYADREAGSDLLARKYGWVREHLFRGVEFGTDNEPLRILSITSKLTGKCLDVKGWSQDDRANVQQYACHGGDNQRFAFLPDESGHYEIVAMHSGKALDVAGGSQANNANVQQFTRHSGDNQKWELVADGDGFHEIISRNSGKCLDVAGLSHDNGANIQQYTPHGGDNQKWRLS